MHLIVNSQTFKDPPLVDDSGGTAEIYSLGGGALAKIFTNKIDVGNRLWFERKNKILALCNKFQTHTAQLGASRFAFPEHPAYELTVSPDTLAGFAMKDFGRIPKLAELGYDIETGDFRTAGGVKFTEQSAIGLVYQIFEALDALHRVRIILGDVSPNNLLFSSSLRHPVVIDIDSAQIGAFGCTEVTPAFEAPELKTRGRDLNGNYVYDTGTDIFAAAVVCFEFLVGAMPHFLFLSPPKTAMENRDLGVSSIRCFAMGPHYLAPLGLTYADVPENRAIQQRLDRLKGIDPILFRFFVSVFVKNERANLLTFLPQEDQRNPGYLFLVKPEFKEFIAKLVEERRKANAAANASQPATPTAAPAESVVFADFRAFIGSLGGKSQVQQPSIPAVPVTPSPVRTGQSARRTSTPTRSDPPELAAFLKQFDLAV